MERAMPEEYIGGRRLRPPTFMEGEMSLDRSHCRIRSRRRSEEERDTSIIGHVHNALRHYNAKNPGAEFDPVKPLMAACVGFRGAIWVHVSFLARRRRSSRRRNKVDEPAAHFFAELHYDDFTYKPTVKTCTIVENPWRHFKTKSHNLKTKCAFCPRSFEILHPKDGKFVCGKMGQEKEFRWYLNQLEKPFTCPKGEARNGPPPEEEGRRCLGWILYPFTFFRDFIMGFLYAFDSKLKKWITCPG